MCHTLAPMYAHCAHDFINLLINARNVHARKIVYDKCPLIATTRSLFSESTTTRHVAKRSFQYKVLYYWD